MSEQSNAPVQESSQPVSPESESSELEALESELGAESLEGSEESSSSSKESASKSEGQQAKADKAAKDSGAKKVDNDTYRIKVDGEEVELTRDEMIRYAQLGKAGQKRMAEAAQIKKEAMELVMLLKQDPEAVLSDPAILGSREEVVKFAQKILAKQLEEESKSPEVREKERLERELEELRRQMREQEEQRQREEYERLVAQEEARLDKEVTEAIESSGLPKSPFVLKRMVDVLITAAENGKDISPKQAINIVRKEMMRDLKEFFGGTPEDLIEELIGSDRIKAIRKKQLAKIKSENVVPPSPNSVKPTVQKAPEKSEKISVKDWLRGK